MKYCNSVVVDNECFRIIRALDAVVYIILLEKLDCFETKSTGGVKMIEKHNYSRLSCC